jgi:oligoribonuclease
VKEAIIWIDAEFSGTSPQADELLEIAAIITDLNGKQKGQPFESLFDVANLSKVISSSSDLVKEMHDKSGLWYALWSSNTESFRTVQSNLLAWIENIVSEETVLYFGGNSITKDRNFVEVNLPEVYERISHQSVDVTSLAITLKATAKASSFSKEHKHRALADVKESIGEYLHYVNFVKSLARSAA